MSWRLLVAPAMMITFSIAQVVNGRLSNSIRGEAKFAPGIVLRVSRAGFLSGLVFSTIAYIAGPPLVSLFLGSQWEGAGAILRTLTPLFLSIAISGPVNMSLVIIGRSDIHLRWEIARVLVLVTVLSITQVLAPGFLATILAYSCVMLVMSILFVALANRQVNRSCRTNSS